MPLRMIWQMMPAALLGLGMGRLVAGNHFVLFGGMIVSFLIGVKFGIAGLCAAWLLAFPLIFAVNLKLWLPALGVNIRQFLGAAKVPMLASAGMCISVASARTLGLSEDLSELLVLIAVGATSYLAIVWTLDRSVVRSVRRYSNNETNQGYLPLLRRQGRHRLAASVASNDRLSGPCSISARIHRPWRRSSN